MLHKLKSDNRLTHSTVIVELHNELILESSTSRKGLTGCDNSKSIEHWSLMAE